MTASCWTTLSLNQCSGEFKEGWRSQIGLIQFCISPPRTTGVDGGSERLPAGWIEFSKEEGTTFYIVKKMKVWLLLVPRIPIYLEGM